MDICFVNIGYTFFFFFLSTLIFWSELKNEWNSHRIFERNEITTEFLSPIFCFHQNAACATIYSKSSKRIVFLVTHKHSLIGTKYMNPKAFPCMFYFQWTY